MTEQIRKGAFALPIPAMCEEHGAGLL